MKRNFTKVCSLFIAAALVCGTTLAYSKPQTMSFPHSVVLDDGTNVAVSITIPNYFGELDVHVPWYLPNSDPNLTGEYTSAPVNLSVMLAPEKGSSLFTIELHTRFEKGRWGESSLDGYSYSPSRQSFAPLIAHNNGNLSWGGGTMTFTDSGNSPVRGWVRGTSNYYPDYDKDFSSLITFDLLVLTPSDISTYLSTGEIFGYTWPGLADVLNGAKKSMPISSRTLLNGKPIALDSYNIDGNNYVKLRDLATMLNGSRKQFSIDFDAAHNSIALTLGKPYKAVGGEMAVPSSAPKQATPSTSNALLNGTKFYPKAYSIEGNNYFKLRELAREFNFSIAYNNVHDYITIDTTSSYSAD